MLKVCNMDAIFIQSFHNEIENKQLEKLLIRIYDNLKQKDTKIVIFLNFQSIDIVKTLQTPTGANIDIVHIDEEDSANPTSRIFHFLINYKKTEFNKILLLECDCFLLKNFDEEIKKFESNLGKTWYIIGSAYYGLMPWMNDPEHELERKAHMNGVALYNRTKDFIDFINYIFISNEIEQQLTNYDFAMHQYSFSFGMIDKYIDCPYILNISSNIHDMELTHHNLKPKAVIIHTKNKTYYT